MSRRSVSAMRALAGEFDERRRRLWAAAEARLHGWGGVAAVARATGMSATTIHKGLRELESARHLSRAGCAALAVAVSR